MNIRPTNDNILIQRIESEEQTEGGLFIPKTAQEKNNTGIIVGVGRGRILDNGQLIEPRVKTGDKVIFGKYANEIEIDNNKFVLIREDEIFGVIEE
jgi:chaperonin GroES